MGLDELISISGLRFSTLEQGESNMKEKVFGIKAAVIVCVLSGVGHGFAQTEAGGGGTSNTVVKAKPKAPAVSKPKSPTRTKSKPTAKSKTATPVRKSDPPVSRNAAYYFDYARRSCGESDLDCKVENFSKAISLAPQDPAPYFNRGLVYFNKKFYSSAIADYSKVIELGGQNDTLAAAYNNRAWTYCHTGAYDKALDDADKSLELRPNSPETLDTRGTAYMGKGNYRLALADFNQAIRAAPSNAELYKSRAKLYRITGKTTLAEADERKIVELGGTLQ